MMLPCSLLKQIILLWFPDELLTGFLFSDYQITISIIPIISGAG